MYKATRRVQLHSGRVLIAGRGGVEPPHAASTQAVPLRAVLPGLQQRRAQLQAGEPCRHCGEQQVILDLQLFFAAAELGPADRFKGTWFKRCKQFRTSTVKFDLSF